MKVFGYALVVGLWLGAGVYLLLHGHPIVGGFCIFAAACLEYTSGDKKETK